MNAIAGHAPSSDIESRYAWLRLATVVALSAVGGVGMWSVVVALPAIQADFGVDRAAASLPYTVAMIGFAGGGVVIGRLVDRFGILLPLALGTVSLATGYVLVGLSPNLTFVALAHALMGFGCSATFGPLMADVSHWFSRRRGIAVAIAASGNYIAGTIWPPLVQHFIATQGWRATHIAIGILCLCIMLPLSLPLRRRLDAHASVSAGVAAARKQAEAPFSPLTLQILLCVAGVACCVAMSMPQVHIVAYCGDLGYGVARGAEMLSLMLGFGIVSRIASGFIADRIGGVRTLLLGSLLQGTALALYLMFDSLFSLYVISALFGLFQGGIVPSYAIIVREYFSPKEAGTRVGLVLMATLIGMALGGWMSGAIFDLAGSYQAAFLNGLGWNLMNVAIMTWLLLRSRRGGPALAAA
jgi:MFS family permease